MSDLSDVVVSKSHRWLTSYIMLICKHNPDPDTPCGIFNYIEVVNLRSTHIYAKRMPYGLGKTTRPLIDLRLGRFAVGVRKLLLEHWGECYGHSLLAHRGISLMLDVDTIAEHAQME